MQLEETKYSKTDSALHDTPSLALSCGGGRTLTSLYFWWCYAWSYGMHILLCVSNNPIMFLPSCSKDFFFIPPTHILSLWAVCHITFICTYCGFTLPVLHAVKISKSHAHSTLLKFLSHSPLNFSYFNFQTWFLCWKVVSPQYFLIVSVSILCDQINLHLQETK